MSEDKKSYYAIIPANVRYDKKLTIGARMLYGEISALCNEKGYCWASNSYFADLYEVKVGTISRWVSSLKEQHHIKIKINKKDGNQRKISIKPIMINDSTPIIKNDYTYNQKCVELPSKMIIPIIKNDAHNITLNNTLNNYFNEFWNLYPTNRRREKVNCKSKFITKCRKAKDSESEAKRSIMALTNYLKSKDFAKDNYDYFQTSPVFINKWDLDTWLNIESTKTESINQYRKMDEK